MKKAAFAFLMLAAFVLFTALGIWQVQRLGWKNDLIARTEHNLAAAPVAAPAPEAWSALTPENTYTRVTLSGEYIPNKDTLVIASTRFGRGFWVLTPLTTPQGFIVLINRGFITPAQKASLVTPQGPVTVTGLLRLTEPTGSILQTNNPTENRWYSRDITAIAAHHNLSTTAPFFVDAEEGTEASPIGGLTVVSFRNHHLQYALTWFALSLMSLTGLALLFYTPSRN